MLRCLTDYLREVKETMPEAGKNAGMDPNGKGLQSVRYAVSESGDGVVGQIYFHEYLRHVDMGVGRGRPLGSLTTITARPRSAKAGRVFVKDRTYKPKKIYARIAYGKLNWLEGRLMYGLIDEVVAELKSQIEGQ